MTATIGQRLKAAREAQKLTLEKVFEATRIRVPYLQALEADDLSSVPSPVQARGYLRNYAGYLGLDFQQLLDEMRLASIRETSGEVVGPADEASTDLNKPPATQPNEPSDIAQEEPVDVEEETQPASRQSGPSPAFAPGPLAPAGPRPELDARVDATQDRPGRRKKADSQPELASLEAPTKRRGRKKTQPEPERSSNLVPSVDAAQGKLEIVEEPVVSPEPIPQPEPVIDEITDAQPQLPQTDARDHLWQRSLNRLGSVLSARMKRPTLVQRESISPENVSETGFTEAVVTSEKDARQARAEPQNSSSQKSSEIFQEIGAQLRERRELLSLHLDEVERNTHVKAHYLEALEKGAMDELPSTVQTRGMLSNYATFLDMDADALLLRFADALQARYRERNPQKPGRKPGEPIIANIPPIRTFIAGDIIFGVGMAVLLVGFAIWGVSRVVELQSQQEAQPAAPSISDVLLASPDPSLSQATVTLQPVEAFPGPATVTLVIPTQDVNVDVQVNLVAVERTYMRVVVDGEVAFEGRVVPGNAYPFQAESQIEVLVGSGAAIRTVYNGRDFGLMGTFGQIVNNIYTANDVITPTALPSPTATSTVPSTPTASPTATLSSTNTPVPSSTPSP